MAMVSNPQHPYLQTWFRNSLSSWRNCFCVSERFAAIRAALKFKAFSPHFLHSAKPLLALTIAKNGSTLMFVICS